MWGWGGGRTSPVGPRCEGNRRRSVSDDLSKTAGQEGVGRGGHKSRFSCVMRVPLVTLVTLLSISNRRSRILCRGRAARSRGSSCGVGESKHPNAPGGPGGEQQRRGTDPPHTQPRGDADSFAGRPARRRAEAVRTSLGYLDYTHSSSCK